MEEEAKKYLLRILSKRSYLSHECRVKLKKKGFSEEASSKAVAYCQERGYLNDALYLERLIEKEKGHGKSYLALKHKWMNKSGGDGSLFIETGRDKRAFDKEALLHHLAKKKSQDAMKDPQEKKKLIQRLLQKGFSWDVVQEVLNK